jgi:prevent-host-death family protein
MLKTVPAQDLRVRLGEYLDRADLSGDAFLVTRGDRPKAVILGPAEYLELIEKLEALESGRKAPIHDTNEDDDRIVSTQKLKAMLQ